MSDRFRACAVVPTYDNPTTVRGVVEGLLAHLPDVIVVDDGSGPEGRAACAALAEAGLAEVHHHEVNGGKGAAVKTGFAAARARGFTHALQVDADGQHDLDATPAFLAAGAERPDALVVGYPVYDDTAPTVRKVARGITRFWVNLEVGRGVIADAMIGFRVYPLDATAAAGVRGDRMDFDVEAAVRMAWNQVPIINLPVKVRYLNADEGGVSHFRPWLDNLRFCWMHSVLCTTGIFRWFFRKLGIGK